MNLFSSLLSATTPEEEEVYAETYTEEVQALYCPCSTKKGSQRILLGSRYTQEQSQWASEKSGHKLMLAKSLLENLSNFHRNPL